MSQPGIRQGEYAVVCVETQTGIVLACDGSWALGDAKRYRVFASLEDAHSCAAELSAAHPSWEAVVLNSEWVVLGTYVDKSPIREPDRKPPSASWWKKWFGDGA